MPTDTIFSSALPHPRPFQHRINALRRSSCHPLSLHHSVAQQNAVANARRLPITPRQPRLATAAIPPEASAEARQFMLQALVASLRQQARYPTLQAEA